MRVRVRRVGGIAQTMIVGGAGDAQVDKAVDTMDVRPAAVRGAVAPVVPTTDPANRARRPVRDAAALAPRLPHRCAPNSADVVRTLGKIA